MSSTDFIISQITEDTSRFDAYISLFSKCFIGASKYTYNYLKWQYLDNPCGHAIGYDVMIGDQVIAHYAVIPFPAVINNQDCLACWSLNTATHPDYQGRGLFIKLANMTYQLAERMGFYAVVGIANNNSTPGFINKLNFQLFGQLKTKFGYFRNLMLPEKKTGHRKWTNDMLHWRLNNPSKKYYYRNFKQHRRIYAHAYKFNIPFVLGACSSNINLPQKVEKLSLFSLIKPSFFVSHNYNVSGIFFNLPKRILPSPWNIIYRALNETLDISSLDIGICLLDNDTL